MHTLHDQYPLTVCVYVCVCETCEYYNLWALILAEKLFWV